LILQPNKVALMAGGSEQAVEVRIVETDCDRHRADLQVGVEAEFSGVTIGPVQLTHSDGETTARFTLRASVKAPPAVGTLALKASVPGLAIERTGELSLEVEPLQVQLSIPSGVVLFPGKTSRFHIEMNFGGYEGPYTLRFSAAASADVEIQFRSAEDLEFRVRADAPSGEGKVKVEAQVEGRTVGSLSLAYRIRPAAKTLEDEFVRLLNRERTKAGIPVLKRNPAIARVAKNYAAVMAQRQSHATALDGKYLADRLAEENIRGVGGAEISASGFLEARAAVEVLVTGPARQSAFLSPRFNEFDVGVAYTREGVPYYELVFVGPP
jgi:uncharacterized protein YkwD